MSLAQVERKLGRGQDQKEDAMLMMEPYNNWEQKIIPAPYAIAVMGQLMVVSTLTDFPLKSPEDGFKHVRWPDSFRASLTQVCDEGFRAFNLAHNAMDEIKLNTAMVPDHMKNAVEILVTGDDYDVEVSLPNVLANIEDTANTCKDSAQRVAEKFAQVMDLILELRQSCVQTKSVSADQLKQLNLELDHQKRIQSELNENKTRYKDQMNKLDKELDKYSKDYQKALDEIPSGGQILLYKLGDTLNNALSSIASPDKLFKKLFSSGDESDDNTSKKSKTKKTKNTPVSDDDLKLYRIAINLINSATDLDSFFSNGKLQRRVVDDTLDSLLRLHTFDLNKYQEKCNDVNGTRKLKARVLSLCLNLAKIYGDIKYLQDSQIYDGNNVKSLQKHMKNLQNDAMTLHAESQSVIDAPLFSPNLPYHSQNESKADDSTATAAIKNAHFKISESHQILSETEKRFEEAQIKMENTTRELTKTLGEIAKFDAAKATHAEIIEVLQKGIVQLGKLQEQWAQIQMFFEHIATLVKTTMSKQIKNFVKFADDNRSKQLETGQMMSQAMRNIMYKTIFEAVKYSYLVNHLASGYFNISDKHLMKSVSSLGLLLGIESSKEMRQAQLKLTAECEDTANAIKTMMVAHKSDFKRKINNRLNSIKKEFDAILPAIPPEEKKAIEDAVAEGLKNAPKKVAHVDIDDLI